MKDKRIAVLGAGHMGSALLRGILASGWGRRGRLVATHPKTAKAAALRHELGIRVIGDNREAAKNADIVILAVKPQILDAVLVEIAPVVSRGRLVVSIAAGFPTERIEAVLADRVAVVRAMPNVAAVVRLSATVLCAGRHATSRRMAEARKIFESIG